MKSIRPAMSLATLALLLMAGCDKMQPAPKEVTPEHQQCISDVDAYLACLEKGASGLPEAAAKQLARSIDANRNKAGISHEKCQGVLSSATDPSCLP